MRKEPDFRGALRLCGLQVTNQRVAVLRAVAEMPHATADDVLVHVRAELGSISKQAVYDALSVLTSNNLIRRIQPANSAARYEDRVDDNHHHLICRSCGTIVDVQSVTSDVLRLDAEKTNGFEVHEAEVIYWGTCADCQRESAHESDTSSSKK